MRLTVSQYTFETLPFEGTLAVCHHLGFRGVVVGAFKDRGNQGLDPDAIAADPAGTADTLNRLLDRYALECVDFFPQFALDYSSRALNNPDPVIREKTLKQLAGIIDFCVRIRAPGLTVLPGAAFEGRSQEDNLRLSAEMLARVTEMAGERGIHTYFEPHYGSVSDTPEKTLRILQHAPQLKLALDYSHFVVAGIPVEDIHPLLPYTGTFHIRQTKPGKLQSRYDDGVIDFEDVILRLRSVGYHDCLTVEYVWAPVLGLNEADTIHETMATKEALHGLVPVR